MIRKNILMLSLVALVQLPSFAQDDKKANPKHINWYGVATADTKDVGIEIIDGQAMMEYSKFKLKLTNKSTDYILYKPQESLFKFEAGDLKPLDKKTILIQPMDKDNKVIDANWKGSGQNLHVDSYKYQLEGLYKVPVSSPAVQMPNFELPASTNEVEVGKFKIEMVKFSATTAETSVKFKVTYSGDGMALVEPKRLGVKIVSVKGKKFEDEKVYANDSKPNGFLLTKGESETFSATFHIEGKIADMQFANMEIVWKDTFKDCQIVKIDGATLDLAVDKAITAAKNK